MKDSPKDSTSKSSWVDTELEDILDEKRALELDDLRFPEG